MSDFRWYTKKPIPVKARQLSAGKILKTLEGTMYGFAGDYLVTGIKGEQYIVKKEIFEETYDLIDNIEDPGYIPMD